MAHRGLGLRRLELVSVLEPLLGLRGVRLIDESSPLAPHRLVLVLDHLLERLLVDGRLAVLLQLFLEYVARLDQLALLRLELVLHLQQLRLQFHLVHRQRLHLLAQHNHPVGGDDGAHVRHGHLREDLIDQPVVADEARVCDVLD